jgi:thiosulfate/3-mercaptopyruvate sulfurtransferase
MNGGRKK